MPPRLFLSLRAVILHPFLHLTSRFFFLFSVHVKVFPRLFNDILFPASCFPFFPTCVFSCFSLIDKLAYFIYISCIYLCVCSRCCRLPSWWNLFVYYLSYFLSRMEKESPSNRFGLLLFVLSFFLICFYSYIPSPRDLLPLPPPAKKCLSLICL